MVRVSKGGFVKRKRGRNNPSLQDLIIHLFPPNFPFFSQLEGVSDFIERQRRVSITFRRVNFHGKCDCSFPISCDTQMNAAKQTDLNISRILSRPDVTLQHFFDSGFLKFYFED